MGCVCEALREEHDTILFGLTILEQLNELVLASAGYEMDDLKGTVDFFSSFADKCHHGKEEGILFPAMLEAGIPKADGPVGKLLEEHDMCRSFLAGMKKSVEENCVDKEEFCRNSEEYILLLREHIEKENRIIFPVADRKIPAEKQELLSEAFKNFEYGNTDIKTYAEVHDFIDYMEAKYLR